MISPLEDGPDDSSRKLLHSYDVEKHAEEKQRAEVDKLSALPPSNVDSERMVSTKQKFVALLGYFLCNVGLTVYNKAVLGKVRCQAFLQISCIRGRYANILSSSRFLGF